MTSTISNENREGQEVLPFEMDHIPESFRKKCAVELKETPEESRKKTEELRIMLEGSEIASGFNFEKDLLVQFLRHSKYDVQRAFKRVQNYVTCRNKNSQCFTSLPDDYFLSKKSLQLLTHLPKRSPDGCTVVLTRAGQWDPSEMGYDDVFRFFTMLVSQLMRDPMTQINGFVIIHDFKGASWRQLRYCTPRNLYLLYHTCVECIPGRYKSFHFINDSFVMRAVYTILLRFVSEKVKKRVSLHSKPEELLEFYPRSMLPVEYGGDVEDFHMKSWIRTANKEHGMNTIEGQTNYY